MDTSNNSTVINTTEGELLRGYLGDRHRPLGEAWILSFLYFGIFLTGVVGNISTCIVIIKNNYMHTATNYYLFSLAISDVLTLILDSQLSFFSIGFTLSNFLAPTISLAALFCLPPELYAVWEAYPWRFGEPYCLFKTFLTEMTSSASILTITAFTVERYVAICHPIRAQRMSSLSRAIKIILCIWICACLSALPYPIHTRTYYYVKNRAGEPITDSLICNIPPLWMPKMRAVFQFSTFLLFILPMTVITVLYLLIGITLRKAGLARKCSDNASQSHQSRKIIRMLVAVVVAFFICWAPFHAQRLMTSYVTRDEQWTPELMKIQNILWYISGILYFVSSTTNPILYNLMSRKYREAFKHTLCKSCFKQTPQYNGLGSNNRSKGPMTAERSTVYSQYSHASNKKYTSMVKKTSEPVTQTYLGGISRLDNNNFHNESLLMPSSSPRSSHLEPISESVDTNNSYDDQRESCLGINHVTAEIECTKMPQITPGEKASPNNISADSSEDENTPHQCVLPPNGSVLNIEDGTQPDIGVAEPEERVTGDAMELTDVLITDKPL